MEGKGQDGTVIPSMEQKIGGVQRHELLATALTEDNTTLTTISIHTNMKVEGQTENFHHQALQSVESAACSSAGVGAAAMSQCLSHPGPIWDSHMCLQQEQHNLQQRLQQEQHQLG